VLLWGSGIASSTALGRALNLFDHICYCCFVAEARV